MCFAKIINAKKFGDPIDIEWIDSLSDANWQTVEQVMIVPEETFCMTRGFFVGQTDKFIHVIQTKGKTEKNEVAGLLLIPKGVILKVDNGGDRNK